MTIENTISTETTVQAPVAEAVVVETAVTEAVPEVKEVPVLLEKEVEETKTLLSLLSEEFKENKSLQNFKDANDLAKSYVNLNSLLGKKVNDWSKEDVSGFLTKMGRPESQDKYVLPDELRDAADLKLIGFKAGLSQEQLKMVADELILSNRSNTEKMNSELSKKKAETELALKNEFGEAYEKRMKLASKAIAALGGEKLLNLIGNSELGLDVDFIKSMAKYGIDHIDSDRIIHTEHSSSFGITPEEAKKMISIKMADKEFRARYTSASHSQHKEAVEEMRVLFGQLGVQK